MAEPPLSAGAVHVSATSALPAVAVGVPGADGVVAGVAESVAGDAPPSPTLFTARTLNWYALPLVRPVTV